MLKVQTLSSGSKGNITYIGNDTVGILVDIGLTLPQTLKRLEKANVDPKAISAILITHEHSDHIGGVSAFVAKFGTKIYCHNSCKKILVKQLELPNENFIEYDTAFNIGNISVSFFPIPHDSAFCFGYRFVCGDSVVGIATDIGKMTKEILTALATCQLVILESNHDHEKLRANTKYPIWLKRRIVGQKGHLSNTECATTVLELARHNVGQVILAHLSEENNSPNLAYTTIKNFLYQNGVVEGQDIYVDIAPQHTVGNTYNV